MSINFPKYLPKTYRKTIIKIVLFKYLKQAQGWEIPGSYLGNLNSVSLNYLISKMEMSTHKISYS